MLLVMHGAQGYWEMPCQDGEIVADDLLDTEDIGIGKAVDCNSAENSSGPVWARHGPPPQCAGYQNSYVIERAK